MKLHKHSRFDPLVPPASRFLIIQLNIKEVDSSTVSSLFKQYLRSLPNPLIPDGVAVPFARAVCDPGSMQLHFRAALASKALSKPATNVLVAILKHLSRVAQHANTNKMSLENLSICFTPTLTNPVLPMEIKQQCSGV